MTRIQIKALIFDMDSTMVGSILHHTKSLSLFCESHRMALRLQGALACVQSRFAAPTAPLN